MKINVMVADAATYHPDGTVSALRLGITRVFVEKDNEASVSLSFIMQASYAAAEKGKHTLVLTLRDQDGRVIGGEVKAEFSTPGEEGLTFLPPLTFNSKLKRGRYEVDVVADGQLRATWPLHATDRPQAKAA